MDVAYPLLVVGTAERHIIIVNLTQPTTIFKVSLLNMIGSGSLFIIHPSK